MVNSNHNIVVLAEREGGSIAYFTYELLSAATGLAQKTGVPVRTIVAGRGTGTLADELKGFSDEVYLLDDPLLQRFDSAYYAEALVQFLSQTGTGTILLGHTLDNTELAPMIASRLQAQIVTDVTGLDIDQKSGALVCEKPVFGDKITAAIAIDHPLRVVTIRPKVFAALNRKEKEGTPIPFPIDLTGTVTRKEFLETVPGESVSLDKADAVVAGGRGIKEKEHIVYLEDLADSLKRFYTNVEIGASRPLVDNGFFPSSRQIGLTGEKVSPELYIAVAISGASQHLSGITGSKTIIAINKDDQATIFDSSNYGVVGEYEKVIPALIGKLKGLP